MHVILGTPSIKKKSSSVVIVKSKQWVSGLP
jgi:hypothetical protein